MLIKNTFKEYQSMDALNSSKLKDFIESETYFYDKHIAKTIKEKDEDHHIVGRATHSYILEPENSHKEFMIGDKDKRTNAGKANHAVALQQGKSLINEDDFSMIQTFVNKLATLKQWTAYEKYGKHYKEITITVKCPITEIDLKMRADWIVELDNYVVIYDLKTTKETTMEGIIKAIGEFGYLYQNAFYKKICERFFNKPVHFINVFLSKGKGNEICFVQDGEDSDLAMQVVNAALLRYKTCLETNKWNSQFKDQLETYTLMPWQRQKMENYLKRN